jgi:tRNA threonylcarbamoyl adenosine modification protein YjeE
VIDRILADEAATRAAGRALGEALAGGDAIALVGDLGAGKTTLSQAIALGAGVAPDVPVTSPTFTLVQTYPAARFTLVHVDLYRIEHARELPELGLDDLIGRRDTAALVEWADRFDVLPRDHLRIELTHADGDTRRLAARGTGPRGAALAAQWASALG